MIAKSSLESSKNYPLLHTGNPIMSSPVQLHRDNYTIKTSCQYRSRCLSVILCVVYENSVGRCDLHFTMTSARKCGVSHTRKKEYFLQLWSLRSWLICGHGWRQDWEMAPVHYQASSKNHFPPAQFTTHQRRLMQQLNTAPKY